MAEVRDSEPVSHDWPEEYQPAVDRLGKPLAEHHFPENEYRRRMRRVWLMLITSILWPIFSCIGGFLIGLGFNASFLTLYLVVFVFSVWQFRVTRLNRRARVLRFETGLLIWQKGKLVSFPWSEIQSAFIHSDNLSRLTLQAGPGYHYLNIEPRDSHWLRRFTLLFRLSHTQIQLVRDDGAEIKLPGYLTNFSDLLREVQMHIYLKNWDRLWDEFMQNQMAHFERKYYHLGLGYSTLVKLKKLEDLITLNWQGFRFAVFGKNNVWRTVAWSDYKSLRISNFLIVETPSRWRVYNLGALATLENPHILIHFFNEAYNWYCHLRESEDPSSAVELQD